MYRVEDKYMCSEMDMLMLQSKLSTVLRSDNNQANDQGYCITSVYFDDYWDSHLGDTEEGYRLRDKYRIRIYNHSFSSLDYLNADKENRESGYLKLIENNANLEFEGDISISERGNSTFYGARKKSFSFTTEKKQPLCGMEAGKKWNLLSLYYEQNKLSTKLVFDMADYLGMEYTPDCTWVDLYVNGSYEGLYLLT